CVGQNGGHRLIGPMMPLPVCLALLLAAAASGAQVTTVPPSDPVYRLLDDLAAAGRIRTMVAGQRPYSRREIARLFMEAGEPGVAERHARAGSTATLDVMYLRSPSRPVPADSTGAAAATINPFLDNRDGRLYNTSGATVGVE